MALPATDTFTATGPTALTTYSASWTMNTGAMSVASNTVRPDSSSLQCMAHWNADTFNANQYSQCTVPSISNGVYVGPAVRCHASQLTGYYIEAESGDGFYLYKNVNASETQLGSAAAVIAAGVTLRIEASGTTVTPLKNGSQTDTPGAQTDESIASGYAGINGWGQGANSQMDNWEGGNLAGATIVIPVFMNQYRQRR